MNTTVKQEFDVGTSEPLHSIEHGQTMHSQEDPMQISGSSCSEEEYNDSKGLNRHEQRRLKQERDAVQNQRRSELNAAVSEDTRKRFQFLLNQTELFSHFLKSGQKLTRSMKDAADLAATITKNPQKNGGDLDDNARSPNRRRKSRTEKEEDEELLKNEEDESIVPVIFANSPGYISGEMRDYQIQGLNWLISLYDNGINGILADEMGLGKSLQTISFIGYLKHMRNMTGPHLVIVPKTTLYNWLNEFKKWCPSINVFLLHGDKDERTRLVAERLHPGQFEVLLASYETCMIEKSAMRKFSWSYIIIDEAHRIKNENSILSQVVRAFPSRNRLLITGTPLQNNLHELWALLNFLLPDIFGNSEDFDSWFEQHSDSEDKHRVVEQLHKLLRPFLLRRLKDDVEKTLQPRKETKLYIGLAAMQRDWYEKILLKDIDAVNGAVSAKEKTRLLNIVMQLRKCCNHPYLFDGAEPGPPYSTDSHIIENSGKMILLDKLLPRLKSNDSRVLIFSQMSRMLDILEDYCLFRGYEYCRLDGQTPHEERQSQIDIYNAPDSKKFIFLLTTRAGGLGINLATADIVVLYDSDWNPQADLQAMARAHRIGQKKPVHVFRFIAEETVEEKVIERAETKLRLDQLVIQQGRLADQQKVASKDELLSMVRHGVDGILRTKGSMILTEDLDEILQKGEEKTLALDEKFKDTDIMGLQKFSMDGGTSVYEWQGEDYRTKKRDGDNNVSDLFFLELPKRERKQTVNYAIDDYYREALRVGSSSKASGAPRAPRPPKQVHVADFQFYAPRLGELQEREILWFRKSIGYKVPKEGVADGNENMGTWSEEKVAEEQARIDVAEPLTEAEQEEMETLLQDGFGNWNRRDFWAFVRGCERYGREAIDKIASEIESKTVEDVRAYSVVFWKRYQELVDTDRIISKIEEGEAKLYRKEAIIEHLRKKVARYRQPLQQLKIVYGANRGRNYTEEEDRFLVVMLDRLGYGNDEVFDVIRQEIRNSPLFRFDWFFKSRTSVELARRCAQLITMIEKENDELEQKENPKKRKVAPSTKKNSTSSKGKKTKEEEEEEEENEEEEEAEEEMNEGEPEEQQGEVEDDGSEDDNGRNKAKKARKQSTNGTVSKPSLSTSATKKRR